MRGRFAATPAAYWDLAFERSEDGQRWEKVETPRALRSLADSFIDLSLVIEEMRRGGHVRARFAAYRLAGGAA